MFVVMDIAFPVKPDIEYGQLIRAEDGTVLHAFLTSDEQWRMKANLNEITPELKKAIVYKEDKYFYYHPGINVPAIFRAVFNNVIKQKRTSGASTITMQVARMLAPKRRTYFNKVIEMFRAFQLELHYTKDEVLQMYLNLVPYGSNIQGVKAAAILYFNKLPEQLSLSEITALSIIPNRPTTMVLGKNNDRIVKDRNKWLMRFNKDGVFPESNIVDAINEPLNAVRFDAPKAVPQFARRMHTQYPGQPEVYTTIDKRVQSEAEEIVNEYMMALRLKNIHNCAVLIIDNKTREVKTYIGSPDFFDNEHNGQVDGVASPRSPGSTLKPILYAVCADKGIVTPKTIIADVPINMDGYMPENYDLTFRGNVTAEDALKNSLNIPAVKLINETGTDMFIKTLSLGGVSSIWNNRRSFGLSLILGGCTIRLDELTGMYASLANDGVYEPLRWTTDTAKHTGLSRKPVRLFSSSAAYMITSIISDLYRPDLPNLFDNAKDIPKVAWKTGTSYGRKDAWSIGYNKNYTIGVWVGNFDGTGVPELNGAGIATPLLFRIFNTVYKERSQDWLVQPENVGFRYVCKETGRIPEVYCTETVMDYFIPGVSDNRHCDHLKKVCLSPKEDVSYCTNCMPRSGYKVKTYPNISAELTAFYEQQHIPYTKVPEHNPLCSRVFEGVAPYITSLTNNSTYIITDKGKQQLQLQCTAANDVKTVYWYINDKFYKSTAVGERTLFCPETPNVKISCADDKGRNVDIRINVEFI
ncbi:MAG: penicillin-binding protein 1C [Chitinophagales bacterium]|nr:penicillin-binding protein 1C [Chitinophagales bacterium]